MDRSNIWKMMKKLCHSARVNPQKVFPHNLRHLFARTFYKTNKDIVKLADVLGHSNVNTTKNLYYFYRERAPEMHGRYGTGHIKRKCKNEKLF